MTFDEYLDQTSHLECGKPVKRRETWSISRIQFARQVWHDCCESKNKEEAVDKK